MPVNPTWPAENADPYYAELIAGLEELEAGINNIEAGLGADVGPLGLESGPVRYAWVNPNIAGLGTLTLGTASGGTMEALPWRVPFARRLRSFSINVAAAGEAGCVIKVWLYRADGSLGSVANILHYDFGSVAGDAVATVQVVPSTPVDIPPGNYGWLIGTNAVTTAPGIRGASVVAQDPGRSISQMTSFGFAERTGTRGDGLNPAGSAPASIAWATSGTPKLFDVSGGRSPMILLDLIPAT